MFKSLIPLFLISWACSGQAQTLLISDIDDTIKLANVRNLFSAAAYAFDDRSEFTGMSQLYNIIVRDIPDVKVVYLSKAPSWLMSSTHLNFLANANFPQGDYIPRSTYSSDTHKLRTLRNLIESEKPSRVILVGDNGEQDAQVYAQISNEFSSKDIEFLQFIHIVYQNNLVPGQSTFLSRDQIGFVTPIEISLELEKKNLLPSSAVVWMLANVGSHILKQPLDTSEGNVAFPYYMDCSDFVWLWSKETVKYPQLIQLGKELLERCHSSSAF
jgi:hypothetical protein